MFDKYCFYFFFQFQTEVIFLNGVKILAKKYKMLDEILTGPSHDRLYINNQFFVFLKEKYLHRKIEKNLDRITVLEKLRDSSKYDLMRLIYEHRVLSDGNGDVKSRINIFRSVFRIKFNSGGAAIAQKLLNFLYRFKDINDFSLFFPCLHFLLLLLYIVFYTCMYELTCIIHKIINQMIKV